jgi:hypothetical protein
VAKLHQQYKMKKISFRDVKAYPGSAPASDYPSAFPANPFNPNAGEPRRFEGISTDAPQCPQCKVNLLLDNNKNIGSCPNCNSIFSKMQYDSAYSKKATNPGLYSLDGGSNVDMDGGAQYHAGDKTPYGGASWTSSLGN